MQPPNKFLVFLKLQKILGNFASPNRYFTEMDIGILCGQLDYPSPSLGSHDVLDIQTFFNTLLGSFTKIPSPLQSKFRGTQ